MFSFFPFVRTRTVAPKGEIGLMKGDFFFRDALICFFFFLFRFFVDCETCKQDRVERNMVVTSVYDLRFVQYTDCKSQVMLVVLERMKA